MARTHPKTMKAHLYSSTAGGVEQNLTFTSTARSPPPPSRPGQILVEVLSTSLNPADFKVPEQSTFFGRVLICRTPASPGIDFSGRVAAVHPGHKGGFEPGQRVFGCLARPREFGTLGQYVLVEENDLTHLPEGVSDDDAACLGVSVRTAYQSLKYYINTPGRRVFINGGSGGCGVFAIQIAKNMGAHVTVTCSSKNESLVRELGADEVIDYTAVDVLQTLTETAQSEEKGLFDHVIDHIGLPESLYAQSHNFLKPDGYYVQVGAGSISTVVWRTITPRFLGGGRRRYVPLMLENSKQDLEIVARFLQEKKVRVVVDSVVGFSSEEVIAAYKKLRSGRARGKIIVRLSERS
ncbi:hypothetical protein BJX99DRAFT_228237 [Aspergillus californicus]